MKATRYQAATKGPIFIKNLKLWLFYVEFISVFARLSLDLKQGDYKTYFLHLQSTIIIVKIKDFKGQFKSFYNFTSFLGKL